MKPTIAIIGVASCLALNWAALNYTFETTAAPSATPPSDTLPASNQPSARAEPAPPPPNAFVALVAKPLFNPDRAPARDGPAPAASNKPTLATTPTSFPENLKIIGVMTRRNGADAALIKIGDSQPAKWYVVGKDVSGWRVSNIAVHSVVLQSGLHKREITFRQPRADGQSKDPVSQD